MRVFLLLSVLLPVGKSKLSVGKLWPRVNGANDFPHQKTGGSYSDVFRLYVDVLLLGLAGSRPSLAYGGAPWHK